MWFSFENEYQNEMSQKVTDFYPGHPLVNPTWMDCLKNEIMTKVQFSKDYNISVYFQHTYDMSITNKTKQQFYINTLLYHSPDLNKTLFPVSLFLTCPYSLQIPRFKKHLKDSFFEI